MSHKSNNFGRQLLDRTFEDEQQTFPQNATEWQPTELELDRAGKVTNLSDSQSSSQLMLCLTMSRLHENTWLTAEIRTYVMLAVGS